MAQPATARSVIRFGVFEFDPQSGELRKRGLKIKLQGQPVEILLGLLERPGELVTREELRKSLWPADTFVNFEHSLNAAVKRLRRALGDSPGNPRFVETLERRGYRFIAPVQPAAATLPPPQQAIEALAVLPFENSGLDPETEYLSDGITESIINSLSQLSGVKVMARSTVFHYKDRQVDPRLVGRELNVQAVLMGRVLQRGVTLVVGAELVEVQNGWQLWGEQYTRQLSDILSVEEEISKEISDKLRLRLTGEDRSRLAKRYTTSAEAYGDYLKGRYYWNKTTPDGLKQGIAYFQQAIQKDPNFALAYAGLADAYGLFGFINMLPPKQVMPLAKEAAMKALEIDDELAEAHASLAGIRKAYDWDWVGAEAEYKRALSLNPNYAAGHRWYAGYLSAVDRIEEAAREIQKAQELDPLSLVINMEMGWNCYIARQYGRAIDQSLRTLEMEPQFISAYHTLGLAYAQMGRYDEAIAALQKSRDGSDGNPATVAGLGHALAMAGSRNGALQALGELREVSKRSYVSPYWFAVVHAGLGEKDLALEWLQRAYEERDVWLVWLRGEPRLDILRSDPRFEDLLRRVGLA